MNNLVLEFEDGVNLTPATGKIFKNLNNLFIECLFGKLK